MKKLINNWRHIVAVGALVAGVVQIGTIMPASAYGSASQPVAQIGYSGNCDNASFFACQPGFFGTGGFWAWVEIDGGASATSGSAEFTAAGCGHTIGGIGGPGGAGGGGFHGSTTWLKFQGTSSDVLTKFKVFVPQGPESTFPTGTVWWYVLPFLGIAVPVTNGHYAWNPVNAVSLQAQVSP